jgi:GT2 family glycosyltransferase
MSMSRGDAPLDVSVVIATFTEKRWDDLMAAIASVRRQSRVPRELIVVVDHNAALAEHLRAEVPDAVVVENHGARGATGSRNVGVAMASGDVVAFLDDDAEAEADWLQELIPPFEVDENVIGVGGRLQPKWMGKQPRWFPEEFNWVVGCTYRGMPSAVAPVRNFIGANMAFRRYVFESVQFYTGIGHVGGRPLGGSDPDICIRVARQFPGRKLLYLPSALVRHRAHPERARFGYFRSRCYSEGWSKAILRGLFGADALSSERTYTIRTLPAGVLRGLGQALRGDIGGAQRSAAIVAGFGFTVAGFIAGSIGRSRTTET